MKSIALAGFGLGALVVGVLLFVPLWKGASTFMGVHTFMGDPKPDLITAERTARDFLIRDGQLFLRIHDTRQAVLLVTGVDSVDWNRERLAGLLARHPELKSYLPDPARPGGGVPWIRN